MTGRLTSLLLLAGALACALFGIGLLAAAYRALMESDGLGACAGWSGALIAFGFAARAGAEWRGR